jgi:hypothetical protein
MHAQKFTHLALIIIIYFSWKNRWFLVYRPHLYKMKFGSKLFPIPGSLSLSIYIYIQSSFFSCSTEKRSKNLKKNKCQRMLVVVVFKWYFFFSLCLSLSLIDMNIIWSCSSFFLILFMSEYQDKYFLNSLTKKKNGFDVCVFILWK